jgi:hypothetical protein
MSLVYWGVGTAISSLTICIHYFIHSMLSAGYVMRRGLSTRSMRSGALWRTWLCDVVTGCRVLRCPMTAYWACSQASSRKDAVSLMGYMARVRE